MRELETEKAVVQVHKESREGGMVWRDGGVEGWRGGGVEGWRGEGVEGWRGGGVEGMNGRKV
jgi:hypothetical protein